MTTDDTLALIRDGRAALGIELGSTRIKACLISPTGEVLATGSHTWENELRDGFWSYPLDAVHVGLRAAYADLVAALGEAPTRLAALGVSAMMHGYLAFDAKGELLVPFRTWRNTTAAQGAADLSDALGVNIPVRWSIAHLAQAAIDDEDHLPRLARITTLAGYVHRLLSGRDVLGVGDASGVFPIDPATGDYDERLLAIAEARLAFSGHTLSLRSVLPPVVAAGAEAGELTPDGAWALDPSGALQAGAPLCPPEGDAGTGMVATNAVRPRTANVSVGTSVFAMVVLEQRLARPRPEIDIVTTPSGAPVAMVHCNNGSSELGAWMSVFGEFADALGVRASSDEIFAAVLQGAGAVDADTGVLAYNLVAGEPILGTDDGRPLVVRSPGSPFTLAGFARAQLYTVFAALSLGMATLRDEGVALDGVVAHGGLFRSGEIAQRALAASLSAPVSVGEGASEGGAWGIALLALYRRAVLDGDAEGRDLADWLDGHIFAHQTTRQVQPTASEVSAYATWLDRWQSGMGVEHAAIRSIPREGLT